MFELKYHEVNLWRFLCQLIKDNSLWDFSEWWNRFTWPRALPIAFGEITRLRIILVFRHRHRHRHWCSGASGFVKWGKEIFLECDLLFNFKRLKLFKFKAIITAPAIAAIANDSFFDYLVIIEIIKIIWIWASSCAGSGSSN